MLRNGIDGLIKHYFNKHMRIEFVCIITMRKDRVRGVLACVWELIIAQATFLSPSTDQLFPNLLRTST